MAAIVHPTLEESTPPEPGLRQHAANIVRAAVYLGLWVVVASLSSSATLTLVAALVMIGLVGYEMSQVWRHNTPKIITPRPAWADSNNGIIEPHPLGEAEQTLPIPVVPPDGHPSFEGGQLSADGGEYVLYRERTHWSDLVVRLFGPVAFLVFLLILNAGALLPGQRAGIVKLLVIALVVVVVLDWIPPILIGLANLLPLVAFKYPERDRFRMTVRVGVAIGLALVVLLSPISSVLLVLALLLGIGWALRTWALWYCTVYIINESQFRCRHKPPWYVGKETQPSLGLSKIETFEKEVSWYERLFRLDSATITVDTPGTEDDWAHGIPRMRNIRALQDLLKPQIDQEELMVALMKEQNQLLTQIAEIQPHA